MILFYPQCLPKGRTGSGRSAFTLFLPLLLAGGCAFGGTPNAAAGPSSGSDAGATDFVGEAEVETRLPQPAELEALLAEWASLLEEEPTEEGAAAYRAAARFQTGEDTPERTLWALAMIRLHPESPHFERERGREHLAMLEEHFPEALEGVQASVMRGLFRELDRTTALAEEGDRLVEELSTTVEQFKEAIEQLKRIDMNRRPVRDLRADSLPSK